MEKLIIKNLAELTVFAKRIHRHIETIATTNKSAIVVALGGDLGAGKTTFVQALGRAFGVVEMMPSPTFGLMKVYAIVHPRFKYLVHMDAYRIESLSELGPIRFAEIAESPETVLCIEWPERIAEAIPKERLQLFFVSGVGEERIVEIEDTLGE